MTLVGGWGWDREKEGKREGEGEGRESESERERRCIDECVLMWRNKMVIIGLVDLILWLARRLMRCCSVW
jgi:hypothetical protein